MSELLANRCATASVALDHLNPSVSIFMVAKIKVKAIKYVRFVDFCSILQALLCLILPNFLIWVVLQKQHFKQFFHFLQLLLYLPWILKYRAQQLWVRNCSHPRQETFANIPSLTFSCSFNANPKFFSKADLSTALSLVNSDPV